MGTHTLSGSLATGITLTSSGTYLTPFTITQSGAITSSQNGVFSTLVSSLLNEGVISGGKSGVYFKSGGDVTNSDSLSTISGASNGVYLGGNGTITNAGTVEAGGNGIMLASGEITNVGTSSLITCDASYGFGVRVGYDATIVNSGTISGSRAYSTGIRIQGGTITNLGSASLIYGTRYGVVSYDVGSSVTNDGTISGKFVGFGSYSGSVTNSGTILGGISYGVQFQSGGSVSNSGTSSLIEGNSSGVFIYGSYGSVTNHGTTMSVFSSLASYSVDISLRSGGYVGNIGTASVIEGGHEGVYIANSPGKVVNQGLINASLVAVEVSYATGIVLNSGTISGGRIFLQDGGYISNRGTAALISSNITINGSSATLANFGDISGSVQLNGADANTLIMSPGAVFGDVVVDLSSSNVMELAAGTKSGTLNLDSFSGFSTIDFGVGATWSLAGTTSELANG